eukprot:CAMPEP_0197021468 /NCGR_PEP_ID=MMETSP1384-20130603/2347_1 /TAXON_ID=29189 /ORGANISM="Ammonia sp." /LENGTH=1062 /DNA_ID=CAMNT_0042449301 /DNA_START=209 /DNA_END=3397 /DNA_ORIENTATION=-
MTASIPTLTEMVINTLEYEKILKSKLEERNLGYILSLLCEKCDVSTNELFTLSDRAKIEQIITMQIDDNQYIDVKVQSKDKDVFANIVMDVIAIIKVQSQIAQQSMRSVSNHAVSRDIMAMHTQSAYQNGTDQFYNYQAQPHPHEQPAAHAAQPPYAHPQHYEFDAMSSPGPMSNPNPTMDNPPELNFDPDTFDDILSSMPSQLPMSQPLTEIDNNSVVNPGPSSIPSIATMPITPNPHLQQQAHAQPANHAYYHHMNGHAMNPSTSASSSYSEQSSSSKLANAFERKMKEAIQKKANSSTSPAAPTKAITVKKKITVQTNIHPQQQPINNMQQKPPQQAAAPPPDDDDYFDVDDEEGPTIFGMAAPDLEITEKAQADTFQPTPQQCDGSPMANEKQYGYRPSNGYGYSQYAAPTPRDFHYDWDTSPRNPQSTRNTASSPPRISDPMLIQNALQGVAYYADKLDSLHSEYRRCYGEQQQLSQQMNNLHQQQQSQAISMNDYQHQLKSIQSQYYSITQKLQYLIVGIYEQFNKMKQSLSTRYDLQMDPVSRSQFDRFQRYYDEFSNTQHHLLTFGQQQQNAMQQQQQQQQQNQQYNVPPTPYAHRNRVQTAWMAQQQNEEQKYNYHPHHLSTSINSMTPRGHNQSYNYNQYSRGYGNQQHLSTQKMAKTTTAIPDRKFTWNASANQQRGGGMNGGNMPKQSRTPRGNSNNANNGVPKTSADISNVGYVYIGSRMSQLISHIGLSDRDVEAHQKRIEGVVQRALKHDKNFASFDIVSYGSSAHKLFIKDYSDFDFCIRCKDLAIPHQEAVEAIAKALRNSNKNEFGSVEVVDSPKNAIHGDYQQDIYHVKFFDKKSRRSVDLVLNNLPEIGSSRFIAAYESIDPRFALLCRVVKYWAQQRKINNPLNGTLSTYALVLMVINFLQSRRVLPTLSIMTFDRETGLSPWSTQDDFQINVQKYKDFASKNEEPHSRLLVNFFYFYGHKFNYEKDVVSVRTGTYLLKSERKWNVQGQHHLCVENPFNSKVNLTENVDPHNLSRIASEFKRAYHILCDSYKIYEVCKLAD